MTYLVFALSAAVLMTIVSGMYVFVFGCVRRKEPHWLMPEELCGSPYEKYCQHIQDANKWLASHNAQDVWITSHDGLQLHALWVTADNSVGTILFAHGYRSSPLLDFGPAFSYYHKMGFNLLIPDQRSHGKSQGRYITFGVLESKDMQRWIAYHNHRFSNGPVILSGLSMGASTMLYLANKNLPKNVRGIIADCGFTSPKAILSSVFKRVTHLPAAPSVFTAEFFSRCLARFSLWECDTRNILAASRLPVFMIHGKQDDFVPYEMTVEGYDACISEKHLLLVENADHGVSFLVEPVKYKDVIVTFIKEILGDSK